MTALMDFPVVSSPVLPVKGESALVPGTLLRLPLAPVVRDIPVDERCGDCAGTGVFFNGSGRFATNELMTCPCLELSYEQPEPAPLAVIPFYCDPS
jgi:hypothetical protein